MMSSCCTFRLNLRNAFSSGSPSCTRTSAKEYPPPDLPSGHFYHTKNWAIWFKIMILLGFSWGQSRLLWFFYRSHPGKIPFWSSSLRVLRSRKTLADSSLVHETVELPGQPSRAESRRLFSVIF